MGLFFLRLVGAFLSLLRSPPFLGLRFTLTQILAMVDGLAINQEVEALEALANAFGIGYEGNNS